MNRGNLKPNRKIWPAVPGRARPRALIAKRINEFNRNRITEKLQEFDTGDEVSFEPEGDIITGKGIRVDKNSLGIRSERGLNKNNQISSISLDLSCSYC